MGFILMMSEVMASCLLHHIDEAIQLNQQRRQPYSQLSQKRSEPITDALIQMEQKMRRQARFADFYALHWQSRGIGLLCDEFVDMSLTPSFKPRFEDISLLQPQTVQVSDLQSSIKKFLAKKDMNGLEQWSHQIVLELEKEPRTYCLTRHFMESIRRAAGLAPLHEEKSKTEEIASSLFVSREFIKMQADLLNETERIDQMAYALQSEGLPIICQDVPYIPRVLSR